MRRELIECYYEEYQQEDVYKRQEYKPIHDELKKLQNGWTNKRDKYEEAHRAELALWDAANRYLHANLPKGCLLYTSRCV